MAAIWKPKNTNEKLGAHSNLKSLSSHLVFQPSEVISNPIFFVTNLEYPSYLIASSSGFFPKCTSDLFCVSFKAFS